MIDLHTHSTFSDGTYSPEELILEAKKIGLSAIALTDHNTIDGLEQFSKSATKNNITAIRGIEFSSTIETFDLHILALFLEENHYQYIKEILKDGNKEKVKSNYLLIKNLKEKLFFNVSYEELIEEYSEFHINRANIAAYLMKKGYISSVEEGFRTILHKDYGFFVPAKRLNSLKLIEKIKNIGAISILAHPLLNMSPNMLKDFLPIAKQHGLVGVETYYSTYSDEMTDFMLKTADELKLSKSGGSDFHGATKPDIKLGIGKGNLQIDDSLLKHLTSKMNIVS